MRKTTTAMRRRNDDTATTGRPKTAGSALGGAILAGASQGALGVPPRIGQCVVVGSPEESRRLVAAQAAGEGIPPTGSRRVGPEERLLRRIIREARRHGWLVYHPRAARTLNGWVTPVQGDGKGWLDLLMLRGPRLLVVEVKSATGRLTPEQRVWLAAWECVPYCTVMVVRPRDLDRVMALLAAERVEAA